MTVIGICMAKDEADIIAATVRNMVTQCDSVIVADNGSTDGTRDILAALAGHLPLTIVDDPEPAYMQSAKMTGLAALAGQAGADWVVPFDADEWWTSGFGALREVLGAVESDIMVATAELWDHVPTGVDGNEPDPTKRMIWRRDTPLPLPKVACRWRDDLTVHQGNHSATYGGIRPATGPRLTVHHFPYRSPEQFVNKVRNGAAAYRAAGDRLPADAGAHWRGWGQILDDSGEAAVVGIYRKWFWRLTPKTAVCIDGEHQNALVHDPVHGG